MDKNTVANDRREVTARLLKRTMNTAGSNRKLGNVFSFSLPAGDSCPGKTDLCASVCYASETAGSIHFRGHEAVTQRAYRDNLAISLRPDWPAILQSVLDALPTGVLRLHVSGDFYSAGYIRSWAAALENAPHIRAFAFTRSWRIPGLLDALEELRAIPGIRLFASVDAETESRGERPPEGWPVSEMSDLAKTVVKKSLRLFRETRRPFDDATGAALRTACPQQIQKGVTCSTCGLCPGARVEKGTFVPVPLSRDRQRLVTFLRH